MARANAELLLLLCSALIPRPAVGSGSMSGSDPERGRVELRRVQNFASQPRYGECWARALEHLDTRCKDMTSEIQSRVALQFTRCHLSSSGRDFPSCPEGSEVSSCTAGMDPVAFNAYTEFFTHTHSICHFLQSEAWQNRAENTMYRLIETSADVAEQLQSTKQVANDLMEAQTLALQAQKDILTNGEQLKVTLRDSTEGLQSMFSDLSSVSREQQVALSELFNRISFMQSFLLMEAHSLSSCCYNAAALCTSYLITSTPRSSRARLVLLGLVCLNFYLEKKIYQFVLSSNHPEHLHMVGGLTWAFMYKHHMEELVSAYIGVLRRLSASVGVLVLLLVCVRYRDPVQQSLQVLQQLRETHRNLQEVLQRAERLAEQKKKLEDHQPHMKRRSENRRAGSLRCREEKEESNMMSSLAIDSSHLSHLPPSGSPSAQTSPVICHSASHHASDQIPRTLPPPSSPLVYSVLVEDRKPRYSLRSRRSEIH